MADWSDVLAATRAVVDPSTPAEDLAAIAQAQKGLWVQIAGHPNAYPALLDWLSTQGDETVRSAVASRQRQPVAPSVPVPSPSLSESLAPHCTPKRWKKPLLIGGIGALVVIVAVVLVVVFVTHSMASGLNQDQFQAVVDSLRQEEEGYIYTGAELQSKLQQGDVSGESDSCQQQRQTVDSQIRAVTAPIDIPDLTFMHDTLMMLVDNEKHAMSVAEFYLKCVVLLDDVTKIFSQSQDGVSLSVWQSPDLAGHELRVAMYKNVLLFNNYRIEGDTRGDWQTYATTTFKSAVDQAMKS